MEGETVKNEWGLRGKVSIKCKYISHHDASFSSFCPFFQEY